MPRAKITRRGQVTIPRDVREQLRVGPGDHVTFRTREDGSVVVEAVTLRDELRDIATRLRPYTKAVGALTVEQIDEAIGEAVAADHDRIFGRDRG